MREIGSSIVAATEKRRTARRAPTRRRRSVATSRAPRQQERADPGRQRHAHRHQRDRQGIGGDGFHHRRRDRRADGDAGKHHRRPAERRRQVPRISAAMIAVAIMAPDSHPPARSQRIDQRAAGERRQKGQALAHEGWRTELRETRGIGTRHLPTSRRCRRAACADLFRRTREA